MAAQDFQRGAQMAMQAAGIADQMQQRMFMNKLHEAQMNQIVLKQQQEQNLASTAQQWQQGQILPGEFTGTKPMTTRTPESYYDLAGKIIGQPGGLSAGTTILNAATNMEKAGQAETSAQRLMREIMVAQARGGGKTPNEIDLITTMQNDPDPTKRERAKAIVEELRKGKVDVGIGTRSVFGMLPTPVPGIMFDRINKKYMKTDETGDLQDLSSDEVKNLSLQFKEAIPTSDIRVMQQSVPSVMQLITQSRQALDNTTTGPLAGRWKELWSGKIGAADPNFRKLRTDMSLLQTRLMKMHVGSRGGEYIMKHFQEIMDSAKDSPENLKAALDEIETYAKEVGTSIVTPSQPTLSGAMTPMPRQPKQIGRFTVEEE